MSSHFISYRRCVPEGRPLVAAEQVYMNSITRNCYLVMTLLVCSGVLAHLFLTHSRNSCIAYWQFWRALNRYPNTAINIYIYIYIYIYHSSKTWGIIISQALEICCIVPSHYTNKLLNLILELPPGYFLFHLSCIPGLLYMLNLHHHSGSI